MRNLKGPKTIKVKTENGNEFLIFLYERPKIHFMANQKLIIIPIVKDSIIVKKGKKFRFRYYTNGYEQEFESSTPITSIEKTLY